MKEPVICRRPPTRPKCGRCGVAVVNRSDLMGWFDAAPLCGDCLVEVAPPLGWALRVVEAAALGLAGKWPRQAHTVELPMLLELLDGVRAAVGPVQRGSRRVPLALELLDVIGRRGGGDLLLKVLELLDVIRDRGGGELAGELLDVAGRYGRPVSTTTTPRDPGGGKAR